MTDPSSGADILEVSGYSFRRLSPRDWVKLANHITAMRRESLKANITMINGDSAVGLKLLNEFDSRPTTRGDVIDFSFLPPGVEMVFTFAIQQSKADATEADVDTIRLPQDEVSAAVMWLLGLKPKEKGEGGPLAQPAGVESPTETGTTKPTA